MFSLEIHVVHVPHLYGPWFRVAVYWLINCQSGNNRSEKLNRFPSPQPRAVRVYRNDTILTEGQSNQFANGDIFLPYSCYSLDYQPQTFF